MGHRETLVVKIPPGIESGKKLRLRGQGEASESGGPRGDLTVAINVQPHPYFARDGKIFRSRCRSPSPRRSSAPGRRSHPPGHEVVDVARAAPAGRSSASVVKAFRLGLQANPEAGGDLFVVVKVVVPK